MWSLNNRHIPSPTHGAPRHLGAHPPLDLQSWAPFVTLKAWESRGMSFDIAIPARH